MSIHYQLGIDDRRRAVGNSRTAPRAAVHSAQRTARARVAQHRAVQPPDFIGSDPPAICAARLGDPPKRTKAHEIHHPNHSFYSINN
jgi:hypothetical protein